MSWDNDSGQETQPASDDKAWAELTANERAAAAVLGYTATSWETGAPQPASENKLWSELTVCGEDLTTLHTCSLASCVHSLSPSAGHGYSRICTLSDIHNHTGTRLIIN